MKERMKGDVKNILVKVDLVGNGVVNMDSNDQKYLFFDTKSQLRSYHNNTSYAKKNFYREGSELKYKLKISSDCLKNDMFKNEVIAQSPKICHEDAILYSYIASPMSLIRGYLFANKQETLKRSGALTLCDAEQTCNAVSVMETFAKSGEKTSNEGDDDVADNTFYKKETIGNIKYSTIGNIDLMKLQFVSCDQVFDRYAFNPDKFELYKSFLGLRLDNINSELNYYKIKNSVLDIPEFGYKMTNDNVISLVKETLRKLKLIDIRRKGGFARVSNVKIKLVYDPLIDTLNSEDNWISVSSMEDIDNLQFNTYDFYEVINIDEAKKFRETIELKMKESKANAKAATKEKKAKKNE